MLKHNLHQSYELLKQNKLKVFVASISEVLFVFVFLGFFSYFFTKIVEVEYKLKTIAQTSDVKDLISNQTVIQQSSYSLLQYYFMIFVALYVCWCVFQLVSWLCAINIVKKVSLKHFLLKFLSITTAFFLLGLTFLMLLFRLSSITSLSFATLLTPEIVSLLLLVLFFILLYFMFISYAKIDSKLSAAFKSVSFKSFGIFGLLVVINIACLVLLIYAFYLLASFQTSLALLSPLIIIIMALLLIYSKIFFILELK
jgi:hypothetical protein